MLPPRPTILTNMAFWQSPEWMERTDSIYELDPDTGDPEFMPWWKEAWVLFRRKSAYDVILTMGVRESFAYAFLCWITGCPSRQIMTEVFIDEPRPSLLWKVKTAQYQRLARGALGFITSSSTEVTTNALRFKVPSDRFRYVPLNTTISEPTLELQPKGYLFCAGRTLRDYPTLLDVMNATDDPWHVVTGYGELINQTLPPRISVHREIGRGDYLKLLRGASMVILPLLPTERSTGQVVLLEAMSYGKVVITTEAPGTKDIIVTGENGYLVQPGDANEIVSILQKMKEQPSEIERVGRNALRDIVQHYTVPIHTKKRLQAIESLWANRSHD